MPANETARYCEDCGADLSQPIAECSPPPAGPLSASSSSTTEWEVVVSCDRAYFDRVDADQIEFPSTAAERTLQLTGDQVTIGRRSVHQADSPQIDLSGPPLDTGVSRLHALLTRQGDGTWLVTDCDSTNGTYLNDSEEALPPGRPLPFADGDCLHLGAWTTITLRGRSSSPAGAHT
jgi:hypothetical protein